VLWLALLVGGIGCESSPSAPSTSVPVRSIAVTGTLSLRQPGDSGQLTAIATFTDGTTKDVTAEAYWLVIGGVASASAGQVTALGYGGGTITVSIGSAHATVPLRIVPDGAFLIQGKVTDQGAPVAGVKVEATCAAGCYAAVTDAAGAFALPGVGGVTLKTSGEGYQISTTQVAVSGDRQVAIALDRDEVATGPVLGSYTLTFTASPSCTFPPEAVRRTYGAQIKDSRQAVLNLDVWLSGAPLVTSGWFDEAGFVGRFDGRTVRFHISSRSEEFSFAESLPGGMTMSYDGEATGTPSERGIVTAFNGTVTLETRAAVVASCKAADHRLEFTR
jgi:hypothetical protein